MTEKTTGQTGSTPRTRTDVPLTVTLYNRKYLNRLPTAEDGVEGLLELAELFGDEAFFHFVGLMRSAGGGSAAGGKGTGTGIAGEARSIVANRLFDAELARLGSNGTEKMARSVLSRRLGFNTSTHPNFKKILDGVPRRGSTAARPDDDR